MARTPSNMLALGTKAPTFSLLDTTTGAIKNLEELKGPKATLVLFICNHCPFVLHVNSTISKMAMTYKAKGINFIAISSNDAVNYPQDAPDLMTELAKKEGFIFPYLYDPTQEIAKAYDAACTPDFFLFNKDLDLVYRGQLDDSRPGNGMEVNGKDLKDAMNALLNNTEVSKNQKPSIGCNIKWLPTD